MHWQFGDFTVIPSCFDKDKSRKSYGQFQWRIGMLTPVSLVDVLD
jgi:hypothetical protein